MSLRFAATASALLLLATAPGAGAMPMNGTFSVHYDKQTPQPMGPDKVKMEASGSGLNKSPGQPLDNAQVGISETATLNRGQGPLKGTITFTTPTGSTTSPYTGKVATDAQGRVTATGNFKVMSATGAFAGLKGKGSFTTVFSSQTDQTTQWQGEFTPPSPVAAR